MDAGDPPKELDASELEQIAQQMASAIDAEMGDKTWSFGGVCLVAEVIAPDAENEDQIELTIRTRYKGTPPYALGLLELAKRNVENEAGA